MYTLDRRQLTGHNDAAISALSTNSLRRRSGNDSSDPVDKLDKLRLLRQLCPSLQRLGEPKYRQVRPSSGTAVYPHMPILRPHPARTW